jgi:transketolase
MTNLVSRTTLANALRVLAMDAVQQANSDIRACRWAWRI